MQVAILAGGLATRLRPITETIPKAMVPINGKPFLEYQIEFLKKAGMTDLILCVGFLSEKIKRYFGDGHAWGIKIRYSHDGNRLLGTGGALKRAELLLQDDFCVMYGDSYLFLDILDIYARFKKSEKLALMVVYKNNNLFDTSNVAVENGMIIRYDKKNTNGDLVFIDYGFLILKKEVLGIIPSDTVYQLEDVIQALIRNRELVAYEATKRFYEIGSHKGMDEFTRFITDVKS